MRILAAYRAVFTAFLVYSWTSVAADELRTTHAKLADEKPNFDTLSYVHVVWRHGDRTPAIPLWNEEKTFDEKWPEGIGELTTIGMAQQYRLGQWLRARYGGFLGNHFDRNEIYVRSSDYNRTLMSAQANMAGLFPPQKHEIWDQSLLWQPVPIHTMPKDMDIQLNEEAACPIAVDELNRVWNSNSIRELEKRNRELLTFLGEKVGRVPLQIQELWVVYDNLNCQRMHNITHRWPDWLTTEMFDHITKLYNEVSQFEYHTDLLRRLRGGSLLKETFERFRAKVAGQLPKKAKFFAYSAHDSTIAALLSSFGVFPEIFPLYASAVLLEMHNKNGEYVIELYYKNITDSPLLYLIEIPVCPYPCSLDRLHKNLLRYFPENWPKECGFPTDKEDVNKYIVAIAVLAATAILLAGILAMDLWLHRRKRIRRISVESLDGGSRSGVRPLISDDDEEEEIERGHEDI